MLRRSVARCRGTTPVNTARLRVVLRDVEPAVARMIDVPASATLPHRQSEHVQRGVRLDRPSCGRHRHGTRRSSPDAVMNNASNPSSPFASETHWRS
jgi:hypothetical protein